MPIATADSNAKMPTWFIPHGGGPSRRGRKAWIATLADGDDAFSVHIWLI